MSKISFNDFSCAKDFFDSVRDASIDYERTRKVIERMKTSEGVNAQSYTERVNATSTDVNRTCKIDARMDYESRVRQRMEDDLALIDMASNVIYGAGSFGGIAALLGSAYADAMWWRFCAGGSWQETSAGSGMSERWCQEAVCTAIDQVDAYGMVRVVQGLGIAE